MTKYERVDPELFNKIKKKLKLEKSAAYDKIAETANQFTVPKGIAAIKLAAALGISVTQYADNQYYAHFKGGSPDGSLNSAVALPATTKPRIKVIQTSRLVKIDTSKIPDPGLREIINRDIGELNTAIISGVDKTSKTCMILSGSIAEALILERLTRDNKIQAEAISAAHSISQDKPKDPNDPLSWTLANLVAIAQSLTNPILPSDSVPQIGQLRHWRNLVHPGREIKEIATKRITATPPRARNAIGYLEFIADYTHKKSETLA